MTQYSGIFTMQQQAQALTSGQWCTDPYFKNTTLLLHADGVGDGAQNNTFLDASSNGFTITRNGNTTQGSFSPYMPNGYWSNYFDGSGDYLTSASNAALTLGTGSWTVECFVYPTSSSANQGIFGTGTATGCVELFTSGSNGVTYNFYGGSGTSNTYNASLYPNQWNHVALTRSGSTFYISINGSTSTGFAAGGSDTAPGTLFNVGQAKSDRGWYFSGYISNFRATIGTALYTSNFTPSVSPLTAITNTSLLTCQSNRFIDNSTNAFAITAAGNTAVQQFQPFMRPYQYSTSVIGGSGYFDGTGDYLSAASSSAFALPAEYTVELWYYQSGSKTADFGVFAVPTAGGFFIDIDNSPRGICIGRSSQALEITTNTLPIKNAWNHIAVARNSSNVTSVYLNGTRIGTATISSSYVQGAAYIADYNGSLPIDAGYVSDFRLVKGSTVYDPSASTITVPTAPLTAVSNTQLLLGFTNAGIYDNSMQNNLETVGNAQVSTSVVKYGSGSMYFDGTGDYLITPDSPSLDLGAGSFTVECWVYSTSSSGYVAIVGTSTGDSSSTIRWRMYVDSSNLLIIDLYNTSNTSIGYIQFQSTFPRNQWVHCAMVRDGSTFRLYQNGVQSTGSITSSAAIANSSTSVKVASYPGSAITSLNGYIDDLRITKGVARYTSNFQPPQVAFANQ